MKWIWPMVWVSEGGKWGRVAATLLLFVGGMLLGNGLILLAASAGLNEAMKQQPVCLQQFVRPLAVIIASSMALAGCLVGVRFVHHKLLACVFTDGRPFRFSFALQSALLWLVLWFASTLLLPDRWLRLTQRAHELPLVGLFSLAVVMFCATSVQGTLEEVVFRGYLQPRVGAWVGRTWVAVAVVGSIFTAAHIDAWTGPGIMITNGLQIDYSRHNAGRSPV